MEIRAFSAKKQKQMLPAGNNCFADLFLWLLLGGDSEAVSVGYRSDIAVIIAAIDLNSLGVQ